MAETNPTAVELEWFLTGAVGACAPAGVYEVASAPFSVTDGPDPSAVTAGDLASTTGSTTLDLSPYGEGTYHVRIAGRGADGPTVGLPGPASSIQISLMGTIAAQVTDLDGAACGAAPSSGADATVTVAGGPFLQSALVGSSGVGSVQVPEGTYVVTAARGDCVSEPVTVQVAVGEVVAPQIEIPDCPPPPTLVDLAAAIKGPSFPTAANKSLDLYVTVSSDDVAGPSAPRAFVVTREPAPDPRTRLGPSKPSPVRTRADVIGEGGVEGLCRGEVRSVTVTESRAAAGDWIYRVRLDAGDTDPSNDTASATVSVVVVPAPVVEQPPAPVVDLALAADQSHTTLAGGATITYTVSLTNGGETSLNDAVVQHRVSANLDLLSATGSHGFDCATAGSGVLGLEVLCEGGDLAAGATATITLAASLPFTTGPGHDLLFMAQVDPFNEVAEADESNNVRELHATTGEGIVLADQDVPDPKAAIEYAEDQGFTRETIKLVGDECILDANDGKIVFHASGGGGTALANVTTICDFRLLQDRELNPPWTIADVELDHYRGPPGSTCTLSKITDGIWVQVFHLGTGYSPSHHFTGCKLESLTLNGPEGALWQEAFDE